MEAETVDLTELQRPDPDPDLLPAVIPPDAIEEKVALHICRAVLRAESHIERLTEQMEQEHAAWAREIMREQDRVNAWKAGLLAWMQRNSLPKLSSPWFSCFIRKGRTKKVVQNEQQAIALCRQYYPKAIQVTERLVKAELDVAVDTFPKHFEGVVTEETGPDGLTIRRKETK